MLKPFLLAAFLVLSVFPAQALGDQDTHFRNTRWNMTMEEVKAAEDAEFVDEKDGALLYKTEDENGRTMEISYSFEDGRLHLAEYFFLDPDMELEECLQEHDLYRERIRELHGEPQINGLTPVDRSVPDPEATQMTREELLSLLVTEQYMFASIWFMDHAPGHIIIRTQRTHGQIYFSIRYIRPASMEP